MSETKLDKLKLLADLLKKDGLNITNLYDFGIITGYAEDIIIEKLRQHKEIVSLTEDNQVNIAPPDSEIQ